jgi:anaerobic selenocysteine-containing dehydrogenase
MDPRADLWLRVRPGSGGALALGIPNVMIEKGWYDRAFVRDWTNGARTARPVIYDPATDRYERDGGPLPAEDRPHSSVGYIPRSRRGSSASRSQSPTRLMPSTSNRMARPGKRASHHPVVR